MTCNNEWDQLEEVIVGSAIGSKIPKPNKSLMSCMYPTYTEKEILTSDIKNKDLRIPGIKSMKFNIETLRRL